MNNGYSRVYTPVLRNPCIFHQYSVRSAPTYYPTQHAPSSSAINAFLPTPSFYARQSPYISQSTSSYLPQTTPYYYPSSNTVPLIIPFSSYSVPAFSYSPTVSSKGLVIVLIATLILVALDLVIVRPQKSLQPASG